MLNDLEDLVLKLHECLSGSQSAEESRAIVSDIIVSLDENMSQQTISICLSIFFKRHKSLLAFLRRVVCRDELRLCKYELLQFLGRFVAAAEKQVIPHVLEIKETCMAVFNQEKYSDVRCCTFPILIRCFEITSGNSDIAAKMNLSKIVDDLFVAFGNQSKLSASVKSNILILLGQMCRFHPLEMVGLSKKILSLFISTLKTEMTNKFRKPDFNVIAGALEGLCNFLFNFTQSAEEDREQSFDIFDYTKRALLNNSEDIARYAMPKAALILLSKHAEQFADFLYTDYKDVFDRIRQWAQHKNYEMKKLAYSALDSYYKQLAEMLRRKAKEEPDRCKKIFKYFIQRFYGNLVDEINLKETVIAIKGYGAFSGPCKEFMDPKDVKIMFNIIIEICERTFFLNQQQQLSTEPYNHSNPSSELFDEKIYQLPSFIESLAYVCNQLEDTLPEGSVAILEKLVVLAIDCYPKLLKRHGYQTSLAIAHLFIAIQIGKPKLYTEFIARIVYQSFIRIFCYKTSYFLQEDSAQIPESQNDMNSDINENDETQASHNVFNITCTDFIQFWSTLLNLGEFKELSTIGIHVNEKKKLVMVVYDEILGALVKIMKKLDLGLEDEAKSQHQVDTGGVDASSNPVSGLKPLRPKDFEILINLVDFARILLNQKHFDLFEKWMLKFSKEIILLSSRFPLISGFYKLNTLCMKIAIKIDYFTSVETTKMKQDNQSSLMNVDDPFQFEKLNCFHLYKKYVKEIFVRKKQFKDELLASCLEFLLSMPKELVVYNLDEAFDSLENSLELGINYLPMAENSLSSFEYWLANIELAKLKPYYQMVLSKFDDYLQLNKRTNGLNSDDSMLMEEHTVVLKLNYKGKGRKKLPIKLFKKNVDAENSDIYEQIQFRILKILGQLAGEMSHCLYETNPSCQIIAWDTVQRLKFNMPFVDMKPPIYFDRFLQRIVYLSLSSTNRQTKVNACELLHAIVVYMIGKSVTAPQQHQSASSAQAGSYQMNKIYRRIYPALFKLACDVDQFARNLFQPLVMQMIHWFTGNRQYESLETIELLDCIMDSLVDERDASLRDFSASALREFLKWSIKHTPLGSQSSATFLSNNNGKSSVNVKSILKRIFSFLTHPSCSKRLGAALAWNSIYTVFREEDSLVNKHIFELLYYLIESLALSEQDDRMYGTLENSKLALDHIERIIKAKADLLNHQSSDRVKPPGWTEPVLEVAIRWLMRQCGRSETECRHKAMELVYKLAPCVHGIKETKDYFDIKLKSEGEMYFIARFEGFAEKRDRLKESLSTYKRLTDLGVDRFQIGFVKSWLAMLVAPLDCYTWVFSERLLTPKSVFSSQSSCLWLSLQYFLENLINSDLVEVVRRVYYEGRSSEDVVCTPHEIEEFNKAKCTAIIRLIDFLSTFIGIYQKDAIDIIPEQIWSAPFITCLTNMCLDPGRIGFNLADLDVYTNLPIKTRTFFKIFFQTARPDLQNHFRTMASQIIGQNEQYKSMIGSISALRGSTKTEAQASLVQMSTDWLKLSQLVSGYEQLTEFNLYSLSLDLNRIIFDYLCHSHESDKSIRQQESLSCVEAKGKLFNLCLSLNYNGLQMALKKGISASSGDYLLEVLDKCLFASGMTDFLAHYRAEICFWVCKRYEMVVFGYLLGKLCVSFGKCVNLMIGLMEYVCGDKSQRKTYGKKLVDKLYENWRIFEDFWRPESSSLENKILLVTLLTKCILIEPISKHASHSDVYNMYMHLLVDPQTKLNFKCRLLDLLSFFSDSPAPYLLKPHIGQLVAQFPLKSTELTKGEDMYNDYTNAIRKILLAIEFSSSLELIHVVVNVMCREADHICSDEIQGSLVRCLKRLDGTRQTAIINSYWENSFKGLDTTDEERKALVFKKVLMNFLRYCEKPSFLEFLCSNIIYLTRILDTEIRESKYSLLATNKKCAFEILELAYKRLHKDEIFHAIAKLCIVFETSKFGAVKDGKELTKEVLRKCRRALCEEIRFTSSDVEQVRQLARLQLQLHSSAYNCLVALFVRTQTEPKLYLACLFKDDIAKSEFVLEPLVDQKKQYTFAVEVENFRERKTKLISLRNEFRESDTSFSTTANNIDSNGSYIGSLNSSNAYLSTQNAYGSSLSEELSIFDFSGNLSRQSSSQTIPSSQQHVLTTRLSSSERGSYSSSTGTNHSQDMQIEIELDELNQHESMASFVELIQSLVINRITPIYEQGHVPGEMPPWMGFLHRKVSDANTHENVKLFVIRGIINTQQVFKPYAKFWYAPFISFLVNSSLARSGKMDYFSLDLMVLLLSWHAVCIPQSVDKKLITRLFDNLMRRCYDENRAILKNNLELLKTMTECWRDLIEVPASSLYRLLAAGSESPKQMSTGIQLFGVVLSNNIESFVYPQDLSCTDLYTALMKCMKESSRTIHASAAEVFGLLLRNIEVTRVIPMDKERFEELVTSLYQLLKELDESMFITCVHRVALNWPLVSERFMAKLLHQLASLHGEFKLMCAEAVLAGIGKLDEPLLGTSTFMEMVGHRESSLQLVCLKMVYALLKRQTDEELNRLIHIVCDFKKHSHVACRYQMLLILMTVFDMMKQSTKPTSSFDLDTKASVNETLLIALLDEDPTIRLMAQNFWTDRANMPSNTIDRMVLILGKMYSSQTEAEYLSYSTNLLLERTSKSPDYNRLIYENPLSECTFREYNLTADWRRRHEMMTPLFVDTLSSFVDGSDMAFSSSSMATVSNLRATQQSSLQFQATQDMLAPGGIGVVTYDWLTQSSVDTFKESQGVFSEAQSTMLFNAQGKRMQQSKHYNQNSQIGARGAVGGVSSTGQAAAAAAQGSLMSAEQDIMRLRRRFLKDKSTNQVKFYARKQLERKYKEEERQKELKKKRGNQVHKYRQYRIGDFPDIQIKFSDLIVPIQALAQRDNTIAMVLFNDLIGSILAEVSYLKDETEANTIVQSIETNLNSMLTVSESYQPNFIACLLEIALKHTDMFQLDVGLVGAACLNSYQQPIGIVLLEEYLIQGPHYKDQKLSRQPDTKRLKLSEEGKEISKESLLWIELAKLYHSLNDYDNIKGIFSKKVELATVFTKEGLQFESENDFHNARKCYVEALNKDWSLEASQEDYNAEEKRVFKVEEELWEQLMLRCCTELTDWKTMCEWTTDESSLGLSELFECDAYSLEHQFPYAFRSKLKLVLQGESTEQEKHLDLIEFIQSLDADGKRYLEHTYCQEMALINLHQRDFNAAKYFAYMAIKKYLMEWSTISKTIVQGRLTKLQSLQAIVELSEFLKFIEANQVYTFDFNKQIETLINRWQNSMPNMCSDPPSTWDDVITNRCIYMEFIEDKYYTKRSPMTDASTSKAEASMYDYSRLIDHTEERTEKEQSLKRIERVKISMQINFAQAAQYQGNYRLALNKLQQTKSICKNQASHLPDLQVNWMHCYLRTHLARAQFKANKPEEALDIFLNALCLKEIIKYDQHPELIIRADLKHRQQLLHGHFAKFLIDALLALDSAETTLYFDELRSCADNRKRSQLFEYARLEQSEAGLEETLGALLEHGRSALGQVGHEVKGALELASYCDYFLRLIENEEESKGSKPCCLSKNATISTEFPSIVVKNLLNAMRLDSYEARQRFPRLLQIVEAYSHQTLDSFVEQSRDIPCWMFLGWLSQMTALLDRPEAKAVYHIVEAISKQYPQAFIYPFKMSLESFKFEYETREQKAFVARIQASLLQSSLVNQFIGALEQLTNPELLYQDYIREIHVNLNNREAFCRIFRELFTNLIEETGDSSSQGEWGNMRKNFARHIGTHFRSLFGDQGQNIIKLTAEELKQKLALLSKEANEYARLKREGNLGEYSPWLKRFKRNLAKDLEIPGQYKGRSQPLPEYHVKIESFDERILVLTSLRKPKCLTIRGNDQREHRFLVKGGEDQRQDQRIETLFELINDLLKADSRCYQRNLSLKTYQVVPMTTKLALIEWLPETRTMKDVILSARSEEELKQWESTERNPDYAYHKFIEEAGVRAVGAVKARDMKINDKYGVAYVKHSREAACKSFRDVERMVPGDLLRRFIRSMATSSEAYYYLRNQFVMTYAVASACQYILGIGDRHLSNWMIDMNTGRAVGIDFGIAFGHAALNIPVPELVPIRLTRQILKLNAPLEQHGLFEASMLHTLRALRENNDLLMCILDVFIKEPSIDWVGSAERIAKQNQVGGDDDDSGGEYGASTEYARSRVNSVRNKLNGVNPCVVTRDDLMSGIHKNSKYIRHFCEVLMGVNVRDGETGELVMQRARLLNEMGEKYRLTCEEQVKCIVEQSMDPGILSRTWNGWQPYV